MAASRRPRQRIAVRGAVHSPAVVEATADSGQHHRQRRAPPGRHAGLRRAPRARARRGERAAREDAARGRAAHRAAASGVGAAIRLLDAGTGELRLAAATGLVAGGRGAACEVCRSGLRSGSCGVAASLGRQVVVRDVASDPLWAELATRGRRERRSRLLLDADHHDGRPRARHARAVFRQRAQPEHRRARSRHALDAARGHRDSPQAGRDRVARQRGELPLAVRQRRRRRVPSGAERRAAVREPCARADARPRR